MSDATKPDVARLVKEARELDATATKGPWIVETTTEAGHYVSGPDRVLASLGDNTPQPLWDDDGVMHDEDNARFIARARSLLPALADAVERLQGERDELLGEVRRLRKLVDWMIAHNGRHEGAVVELVEDEREAKQRLTLYVCTVGRKEREFGEAVSNALQEVFKPFGLAPSGEPFTVGGEAIDDDGGAK